MTTPGSTDPPPRGRLLLIAGILAAATVAVFFQVHSFEFVRFDDPQYVVSNFRVRSGLNADSIRYAMTAVVSSNWHPLTLVTEMAAVQLFGTSPAVFHVLSMTLHAVNVGLLFLFLARTTRRVWPAVAVAAVWGLHPLRAESVAWVGELKDVLCGFFWLATMLAFAAYRGGPSVMRYVVVLLTALSAMFSKPMAVTLPIVLLLLAYWPLRKPGEPSDRRWWTARIAEQIPLFLAAAAVAAESLHTQTVTGATGNLACFPLQIRLTNAVWSTLVYLADQVVPVRLGLFYPHPAMVGMSVPVLHWGGAGVVLIAITAAAIKLRRTAPFVAVGWFWFLATLLPVIGIVQVGEQARADRYTYLPSVGVTIAVVWSIAGLAAARPKVRPVIAVAGWIWVVALAVLTVVQVGYWRNNATLMAHANDVIAQNYVAKISLSMDAGAAGRTDDAVRLAREAIAVRPQSQEAHHALALALEQAGRNGESFTEYETAVRLDPANAAIRSDFGGLLQRMNRPKDAGVQYREAIRFDPDSIDARDGLAFIAAASGDLDTAITDWSVVVGLDPGDARAQGRLADALRLRGRPGDRAAAVTHYRAAITAGSTDPSVQANLAWQIINDPATSVDEVRAVVPLAKTACDQTGGRAAFPLYVYSVGLARTGEIDRAVATGLAAAAAADAAGQPALAATIRRQIAAYR